jgi:hypothetical protein
MVAIANISSAASRLADAFTHRRLHLAPRFAASRVRRASCAPRRLREDHGSRTLAWLDRDTHEDDEYLGLTVLPQLSIANE